MGVMATMAMGAMADMVMGGIADMATVTAVTPLMGMDLVMDMAQASTRGVWVTDRATRATATAMWPTRSTLPICTARSKAMEFTERWTAITIPASTTPTTTIPDTIEKAVACNRLVL